MLDLRADGTSQSVDYVAPEEFNYAPAAEATVPLNHSASQADQLGISTRSPQLQGAEKGREKASKAKNLRTAGWKNWARKGRGRGGKERWQRSGKRDMTKERWYGGVKREMTKGT
eukprot:365800-Chlamydomonas_euryale.AAC.20